MANERKAMPQLIGLLVIVSLSLTSYGLSLTPLPASTLEFVAVVSRHGGRTPLFTYPNDPYPYNNLQFWPNGPFELTNLGKVQVLQAGRNLRTRYQNYLGSEYLPNYAEVKYNPYNRDFMTAAIISAGLYPPTGPQIWSKTLPWQPVVQSTRKFDVCDLATDNTCPKFMKIFKEQLNEFNSRSKDYVGLLKYLSTMAGKKYSNLSDACNIYDTLLMQSENNFTLPAWTKKVFPDKLRPLSNQYLLKLYAGTDEQVQLGAGPELKLISDMLMMKANRTYESDKKIYIEAAHDCTLASLLTALSKNNTNFEINTSAYLVFELHFSPPDHTVQVLYFDRGNDVDADLMEINGCPSPCPLDKFVSYVDSINPPDFNKACQI